MEKKVPCGRNYSRVLGCTASQDCGSSAILMKHSMADPKDLDILMAKNLNKLREVEPKSVPSLVQ